MGPLFEPCAPQRTHPLVGHRFLSSIALAGLTLLFLLLILFGSQSAAGLSPDNVAVIANPQVAGSYEVAAHYVQARGIPEANLLNVSAPTTETISRSQYNQLEAAVAAGLEAAGLDGSVEALVLTYGVPLKITNQSGKTSPGDNFDENCRCASVDSELALLYSSSDSGNSGRWSNPYYNSFAPFSRSAFNDMLLVTRLDGPTIEDAKALVDSALAAEARNELGRAYFDRDAGLEANANYTWYGEAIEEAFNLSLERGLSAALEVTARDIGREGAQWSNRSSPGAEPANGTVSPFFYWGWYSDRAYYDSFNWREGALGQRIHSYNALSLRDDSWVPGAVADNLTGTAGHVWEPWLDAAARPQTVMEALFDGYTLAEAFWMGSPYLSWQNIVVGDPLYRPVRANVTLSAPVPLTLFPGGNLTGNLTIINNGPLRQSYELALVGSPSGVWGGLTTSSLTLESGEQRKLTLQLNLVADPLALPAGLHKLSFAVISLDGPPLEAAFDLPLTVGAYYSLNIETPETVTVVAGNSGKLNFVLTNTGNAPFLPTLKLAEGDGQSWLADYSRLNLSLPVNFTMAVPVTINLSANATVGDHQLDWELVWPGPPGMGNLTVRVLVLDLRLEGLKLVPDKPRKGQSATLYFDVLSNGLTYNAGADLALLNSAGERLADFELNLSQLPKLVSYNLAPLPAGWNNLTLVLTPPPGIFESDLANNRLVANITILPQVDLRLTNFEVTPGKAGSGRARVNFTATSLPESPQPGFEGDAYLLGPPGQIDLVLDGRLLQRFRLTAATQTFELELTDLDGSHNLSLFLDYNQQWNETDESNNLAWTNIDIVDDSDNGFISAPGGLLSLGTIAVAALLATALCRRGRKGRGPPQNS